MLVRKGRIEVAGGFESWCDRALSALPLLDAPLNAAVAREAARIDLEHRDPADTFLVATARTYGLELVTVDRRLARLPAVRAFPT
jgi:PIN domain nuclease of toxin-antitoxin system